MSKPTLGYPTRTAAAVALREQGLRDAEIAKRMGITHSAVAGLFGSINRTRQRRSEPKSAAVSNTHLIPPEVRTALRPAAAKRAMTVDRLASEILAVVAFDKLTDAILDDGGAA